MAVIECKNCILNRSFIFKEKKVLIIISLAVLIIFSIIVKTYNTNRKIVKYENKLKETYSEVVYIKNNQFIIADKKGNIHLISMSGNDQIILSLQDIESGLNREFTLKDIQKPDLHLKHNNTTNK